MAAAPGAAAGAEEHTHKWEEESDTLGRRGMGKSDTTAGDKHMWKIVSNPDTKCEGAPFL